MSKDKLENININPASEFAEKLKKAIEDKKKLIENNKIIKK
jgi:hypothetical protein